MLDYLQPPAAEQKKSLRKKGRPPGAADKKPRRRRASNKHFPDSVTLNISRSMALSLVRVCPNGGPCNQSTYLRLAIHAALLKDDPIFRQEWTAKTNGGSSHA
jgi:hypothetical protein